MNKKIMNSIEKKDVISFVGGGGKTTIMFNIAFAAAKLGLKVLVSTTTKIFIPEKQNYEKIVLRETIHGETIGTHSGITVFGGHINKGKIIATSEKELENYIESQNFDLVLIEADGSRRKSLKAYKDHEPVVPVFSNKVFAVISLDSIGVIIDERYVYNAKKISSILSKNDGDTITKEDIVSLINSKYGLFKGFASKEKYLVLTKCVNKERKDQFEFIKDKLRGLDDSLKVYMNY
ncbi:MAG: selenium cofactor biosynthesis protein YqeC [Acidaminobacteraceae bacterium]